MEAILHSLTHAFTARSNIPSLPCLFTPKEKQPGWKRSLEFLAGKLPFSAASEQLPLLSAVFFFFFFPFPWDGQGVFSYITGWIIFRHFQLGLRMGTWGILGRLASFLLYPLCVMELEAFLACSVRYCIHTSLSYVKCTKSKTGHGTSSTNPGQCRKEVPVRLIKLHWCCSWK